MVGNLNSRRPDCRAALLLEELLLACILFGCVVEFTTLSALVDPFISNMTPNFTQDVDLRFETVHYPLQNLGLYRSFDK